MLRCLTVAFACVVDRDLQARGASLVERHKVDPGKTKKAAAGGKEGGKKTFTWSREEDFEQRKKFTPQVKKCFVSFRSCVLRGVLAIKAAWLCIIA